MRCGKTGTIHKCKLDFWDIGLSATTAQIVDTTPIIMMRAGDFKKKTKKNDSTAADQPLGNAGDPPDGGGSESEDI